MTLHKIRLSTRHVLLLFTILFLFGLAIRIYPHLAYHPMPGSWDIYFAYPFWHLGTTVHHLSQIAELPTYGYTLPVSAGVTIDQGYYIFNAILVKVLGLSETQYFLWLRYFLIIPLVVFPLCVFAIYSYLCRQNGWEKDNKNLILLYAFALFGSYGIINFTSFTIAANGVAVFWSLMILAVYFLVRSRLDLRFGALFLVLCACIASFYSTTAGFFLAALFIGLAALFVGAVTVVVIPKLRKRSAPTKINPGIKHLIKAYLPYIVMGIAITLAWCAIVNKDLISSIINVTLSWLPATGQPIPGIPGEPIPGEPAALAILPYLLKDSVGILSLKAVIIVASAIPVLYLMFLLFARRLGNTHVQTKAMAVAVLVLVLALVPTLGYLFIHLGLLTAVSRTNEFLPISATISLAIILACFRRSVAIRYILILLVLAMCCSAYVAVAHTHTPANRLTHPEYNAIAWLSATSSTEDVIYTDGRMGTTFAMFDHFRVTGASTSQGDAPPYQSIANVEAVYYGDDASNALESICESKLDGESPKYVLFSTRVAEPRTGVHGYRLRFKPAPEGFLDKFDSLPGMNLVYSNATATVFSIRSHGQ